MRNPLLCDSQDKAKLEARNGVEQIDYIAGLVSYGITDLRESHVLKLHELAIADIYPCGGEYRTARDRVEITGSPHVLPEAAFVPSLTRDAVDQINADRGSRTALERAAYSLWRFNWIHPFKGGNGRTSRALTYLIVCMEHGALLPGTPTMPTQIYAHRARYIEALRAVDRSVAGDPHAHPDVAPMTDFLEEMLTRQLAAVIQRLARPA